MFIDFMPVIIAVAAITTGPIVIGLVFRLLGLRLAARIAAALSIIASVAFIVLIASAGGSGWPFVIIQLMLAAALWFGSPLRPAAPDAPAPADPPDRP